MSNEVVASGLCVWLHKRPGHTSWMNDSGTKFSSQHCHIGRNRPTKDDRYPHSRALFPEKSAGKSGPCRCGTVRDFLTPGQAHIPTLTQYLAHSILLAPAPTPFETATAHAAQSSKAIPDTKKEQYCVDQSYESLPERHLVDVRCSGVLPSRRSIGTHRDHTAQEPDPSSVQRSMRAICRRFPILAVECGLKPTSCDEE